MFEDMVGDFFRDTPDVAFGPEKQSMEEFDNEALQLLQDIRDELVALNNSGRSPRPLQPRDRAQRTTATQADALEGRFRGLHGQLPGFGFDGIHSATLD
jgi:hypothetical protein